MWHGHCSTWRSELRVNSLLCFHSSYPKPSLTSLFSVSPWQPWLEIKGVEMLTALVLISVPSILPTAAGLERARALFIRWAQGLPGELETLTEPIQVLPGD